MIQQVTEETLILSQSFDERVFHIGEIGKFEITFGVMLGGCFQFLRLHHDIADLHRGGSRHIDIILRAALGIDLGDNLRKQLSLVLGQLDRIRYRQTDNRFRDLRFAAMRFPLNLLKIVRFYLISNIDADAAAARFEDIEQVGNVDIIFMHVRIFKA